MNLSIIVIGYNVEAFIPFSFKGIYEALECATDLISNFEIIYVDSGSSDRSLELAGQYKAKIVSLCQGIPSAAAGRSIGIRESKYDNLLFLDSDMVLEKRFFQDSFEVYQREGACVGERSEYSFDIDTLKSVLIDDKFYGFKKVEPVMKFGGFLFISKKSLNFNEYNPFISSEEEATLYVSLYSVQKVFSIPNIAYRHLNRKSKHSILKSYFTSEFRIDYFSSAILAIKQGDFSSFLLIQRDYSCAILFWILIILSLPIFSYSITIVLATLCFIAARRKKSFIITTIFSPYKLIAFLWYRLPVRTMKFKGERKTYTITGNFFKYFVKERINSKNP